MGTILQEAIAAAPPTCSARTGEAPGDWPGVPLYCHVKVGLRRYVDIHGATQFYCARPTHERAVRSRYPEARDTRSGEERVMDAAWGRLESPENRAARLGLVERGTATFDAPDWDERKARMDAEMMADLELMADEFHGSIR